VNQQERIWKEYRLQENCVHVTDHNAVRLYFAQFTLALGSLASILRQQTGGTSSETVAVCGFIDRLLETFRLLALKYFYQRPGDGLRIDATDSGFLHFSTLIETEADLAGRMKALTEFATVPDLKAEMADRIIRLRCSSRDIQEKIATRLYLEGLCAHKVFHAFLPGTLITVNPDEKQKSSFWSFATYDRTLNRPFLYLLYFTHRADQELTTSSEAFRTLATQAERLASGNLNLLGFSGLLDDAVESISLKIVKRIILGPYWSPHFTENEGPLGPLLDGVKEQLPFVLRWEAETLISDRERVVGKSLLSRGRLKQVFWIPKSLDLSTRGVSHLERFVLMPYWLGQHLKPAGLFPDHHHYVIDKEDEVYGVH